MIVDDSDEVDEVHTACSDFDQSNDASPLRGRAPCGSDDERSHSGSSARVATVDLDHWGEEDAPGGFCALIDPIAQRRYLLPKNRVQKGKSKLGFRFLSLSLSLSLFTHV